jgi:hypothetical protein
VCGAVDRLEPESIRHFWGLLDAAGGTEAAIVRAARRDRRVRRLVAAAARAGATARLEELAGRGDETGRYATLLLARAEPAREAVSVA